MSKKLFLKTIPENFFYEVKSELKRRLFDLFLIIENYREEGFDEMIEQLEAYFNSSEWSDLPDVDFLEEFKEHLINGEFSSVRLPEGTRLRCLQWVDKQKKKQRRPFQHLNRKQVTFEDIFQKKEYAKIVLERLADEGYLVDGKWNREDGRPKNDIVIPYYALKMYFSVFKGESISETSRIKAWSKGLGVTVTENEIRSLRKNPLEGKNPTNTFQMRLKEFFVIFNNHFTRK